MTFLYNSDEKFTFWFTSTIYILSFSGGFGNNYVGVNPKAWKTRICNNPKLNIRTVVLLCTTVYCSFGKQMSVLLDYKILFLFFHGC